MNLSIIIPVYNDFMGLKSTVTTLLNNNPELKDFEIIICIDGGHNLDINMATELIQLYPKVKISYICIKPNKGSYNARNIGSEKATGNVFSFLDAGVYVQKGWYSALKTHIQNYDYIAGAIEIPWEWANTLFEKYESITGFPVQEYLSNSHFGPTANVSVRKSAFKKVDGFDGRLQSGGDCHFGKKIHNNELAQFFAQDMLVLHAPRNRTELIKKIDRVNKGLATLQKLHPEFHQIAKQSHLRFLIDNMRNILFSPSKFKAKRSNKLSSMEFLIAQSTVTFQHFLGRRKHFK